MRGRATVALAATLLTLVSATAQAGPPSRQRLARVDQLLDQWRDAEALVALKPLAKSAGDHPAVLLLRGRALFHQGQYSEALELLRRAARKSPANMRIKATRNLVASTARTVKGYASKLSAGKHFRVLSTPGKDQLLAHFAGQTLEAMRRELKQELGYAPSDVIRVEVYPTVESLAQVSTLSVREIKRTGTIALCKYNRLMIVSPRALPRGYSWRDTLAHEYVHLVVSRASHNAVPIWLHEGLAKHFEARWRSPASSERRLAPVQRHLLGEAQRTGRFIPWARMHPSMAKLPNQQATALAFAQVQTAMDYTARAAGGGGLRQLLERMRRGRSDWQALSDVTGLERARFTRGWRRHLRTLGLRPLPGLVPPELRFGKAPTREQRLAAIKEKRARAYLRLADMMRTRGLPRPAIIEYLKARALLGPRNDLVANHLARAYLEISSPAQAISALLPVLEYYPQLPGPQVTMATAYLRSGNKIAAARHLRVALGINPFNPEVHCGLATALQASEKHAAGRHRALCKRLVATASGAAAR